MPVPYYISFYEGFYGCECVCVCITIYLNIFFPLCSNDHCNKNDFLACL